jgi:hypothetical protein
MPESGCLDPSHAGMTEPHMPNCHTQLLSVQLGIRKKRCIALHKQCKNPALLVPSWQGIGNLVNGCVILVCMAIFGLTGSKLDPIGSRNVIIVQFAVGSAVAAFMVFWRWFKLKESRVCVLFLLPT